MAAADKLNGTWLQETLEGDITEWFTYEGVGWVQRQALWMVGYGNGKTMLDQLYHDGKCYSIKTVDETNNFRGYVPITGKKEPLLFSESFPFAQIRNMEIQGSIDADGSLETIIYQPSGAEHSRATRSVSEDGQVMTTTMTFPAGEWGGEEGGTLTMTSTHRKQATARLIAEEVAGWAPGCTMTDAIESGVEGKKLAISFSLEGMFPSGQAIMKLLEETNRKPEGESNIEERGLGAFVVTVTEPGGAVVTHEQKFDHEALTFDVTVGSGGTSFGTWHFRVIAGPLRLTCWNTIADEMWSTKSAVEECQKLVEKLLKAQKQG